MDASKLIKMKMEAANVYKRLWQPRDASEVTQMRASRAAAGNSSVHQGPESGCCVHPKIVGEQPGGFSTTYSYDIVRERIAGCTVCNDVNYGKGYGIDLKSCDEVTQILSHPPNPIKGRDLTCGKSTEVVQRGITGDCSVGPCPPAYTGYMNQVPR